MALIGTLRTKMTKWVVGFVAVAIVSFILNDLFGNSPTSIFGGTDNTIGQIGGNRITLEEFQSAVQERENNYILSFGRQAGDREMTTLRQQAWDLLVSRNAIVPEYQKVGIAVTPEEEWDMVQGRNADEGVKTSFTDSAGNFDRSRLMEYLKQVDKQPITSEMRVRWEMFRRDLAPARARIKYENLLIKTGYVTKAEAEQKYHIDNDVAEIRYLYVPFYAVRDSVVKVTDADLKSYYEKNKERYKTEELRSLIYVSVPVTPTSADSAELRTEMDRLTSELAKSDEDSTFAALNTEGTSPYTKYTIATLPTALAGQVSTLRAGAMVGPTLESGNYTVMKVSKIGTDTTFQMKASHILIRWDNETAEAKKKAKDTAQMVLNKIKRGTDFAIMAREYGTDGTASRGGDLGWFPSGQMVKPFEKPIASAKKTGLINELVETEFGYHIIDVTALKDNTVYYVATIEVPVSPSEETVDEAFRKADTFAAGLDGIDDFKERATQQGLVVLDANDISPSDRRVGNLGESREIVTWLFREGKIDKVSEVFDLEDQYAVAVMTDQVDEGYKPLEKVKDQITPAAKNEAVANYVIGKLQGEGSLEELAKVFAPDAVVGTSSDVKLNTGALPNVGFDPIAVGKAFTLEAGKRSKPFKGENGVLVIESVNKTVAPAMEDYGIFKSQLVQDANSRAGMNIAEAIKSNSGIEDRRYKFY